MYELFKLSDKESADYESYTMNMSIGDLMTSSHSSPIQRLRNEKKEAGIMKFIESRLNANKTPFFQPFIMHYSGHALKTDNKSVLNPVANFEVEIETEEGPELKKFDFEVIDGNGRLNAMIRLNKKYTDEIAKLNKFLTETKDSRKSKTAKKKVFELRTKIQALKNTKIVCHLYLNLDDSQKMDLFNSVNQGEPMAKGRLEVYSKSTKENILLHDYILHTQEIDFPYIITADKDSLRTNRDRSKYIPAVYILPVFRKIVKYYGKETEIDSFKEEAFKILDIYICNADNPPHLRKQFFSILGTVIETAKNYEKDLEEYVIKALNFDYSEIGDVSKELRKMRSSVVEYVFKDEVLEKEFA